MRVLRAVAICCDGNSEFYKRKVQGSLVITNGKCYISKKDKVLHEAELNTIHSDLFIQDINANSLLKLFGLGKRIDKNEIINGEIILGYNKLFIRENGTGNFYECYVVKLESITPIQYNHSEFLTLDVIDFIKSTVYKKNIKIVNMHAGNTTIYTHTELLSFMNLNDDVHVKKTHTAKHYRKHNKKDNKDSIKDYTDDISNFGLPVIDEVECEEEVQEQGDIRYQTSSLVNTSLNGYIKNVNDDIYIETDDGVLYPLLKKIN